MVEIEDSPREYFYDELEKLDAVIQASVTISERNIGNIHTGRQRRALFVYAKLIAHQLSILSVATKVLHASEGDVLLDHFSIATLGRATMDAGLMTMYLTEPTLTKDEWNLRRNILYLHDLSNRKRFLKALSKAIGIEDMGDMSLSDPVKKILLTDISLHASNLKYGTEEIAKFQKGQLVYISGLRGAVREAGWDVNEFEFYQSHYSAFVHSHPVSFMRADEHKISFAIPSEFQYKLCASVFSILGEYSKDVNKRMDKFSLIAGDPLGHIE